MQIVKNFNEIDSKNVDIAGGKGASLGEMTQANIPVPEGFVILSNVFEKFLENANIGAEIESILNTVNTDAVHTIDEASEKIQYLILNAEMLEGIKETIEKSFKELNTKYVAVRSSATSEDSADAAWAGQLDTFLNTTKNDLLDNVKKCWASLFTPRAIFYRFEKKLHKEKVSVAVVVQKMIESEESGIAFSVHPVTENYNHIIIEAGLGLGEAIVSGQVTPDSYVVDKQDLNIIEIAINEQSKALYKKKGGGNEWKELGEKGKKQVLTKKEIIELSKLVVKIENHYGFPVDIEWAKVSGKLYITQSRPITTLAKTLNKENEPDKIINKFLKEIPLEKIYKLSFETIPLFWTIPLHFFNDKLEKIFTPMIMIKHKNESHLLLDSDYNFGLPRKVLEAYLNGKYNLLKKMRKNYEEKTKEADSLYNDVLKKQNYSEKELKLIFERGIRVFQDFFVSASLAYLDHASIFDVVKNKKEIDLEKIKQMSEIDIHKSFELINEETIIKFKEQNKTDYKLLSYLFTSYSNVPEESEVKRIIGKEKVSQLKKSISDKNNNLSLNLDKYDDLYKSLNTDEKHLVDFIQVVKDIRDNRKQYFSKIFFSLFRISELFLNKWEIDDIDNGYIFWYELLKGKDYILENKDEIQKRKEGYILYCDTEDEPKIRPFSGNTKLAMDGFMDKIIKKDLKSIKGITGYKGKVSGKVVVSIKNEDFSKIKDGSILVTSMTRPEVMPFIKKVKAIVTDEGGITCHAAIISRELKIPCIIATKVATQVLKDGMEVEVDANEGVVKIL